MGDRGEDMQQMTTGRILTRGAVFRTEPIWYALCPVSHRGAPVLKHYYHLANAALLEL